MDGFGSRLAARFRQAVEREQSDRRREEEERQRALERGRAAREDLLRELAQVGRGIGALTVAEDPAGVSLGYRGRVLRFLREGEGDRVKVAYEGQSEGEEHWLYRQAELDHRWVYGRRKKPRDERLPLFDQGLEDLLVRVLGLPRPGEQDAPPVDPKDRSL